MQQQQPRAVNPESSEGAAALGPVSDIHSINDVHRQAVVGLESLNSLLRPWDSARPLERVVPGSDSQGRMDQSQI